MRHPRYEVRSITGYSERSLGGAKASTTWWVADTWNCYREMPLMTTVSESEKHLGSWLTTRRAQAERNCERLNREHDEWLARG